MARGRTFQTDLTMLPMSLIESHSAPPSQRLSMTIATASALYAFRNSAIRALGDSAATSAAASCAR